MKRGCGTLIFISITIISITFFPIHAYAKNSGQAGVGVLSAPPQYSIIRFAQQGDFIRTYITVSDINSWEDIYSVSIVLENSNVEQAVFRYQQYKNESSWEKINTFEEISKENNLLVTKKCSYDHSDIEEILKGCYLNLIFVFQTTQFSNLKIFASDRGGATSTLDLDYSSEDILRSSNIIIIPGIDKSISIEIPGYVLDIIALFIATIGTYYIIKKKRVGNLMRAFNEKN